jgi:EAL domain-containing protein (putative c-di-GMP-specific phosphodiesterase class I)
MKGSLLDRVFAPDGISVRFQPVVEAGADGTFPWCYVEGLVSGPAGTNLASADVLFSYIRRKRETTRMDRACVAAVLAAGSTFPLDVVIGLNVNAATLTSDAGFADFLKSTAARHGLAGSRLIVEIVEHTLPTETRAFRDALTALRAAGVRVALDDVGCAYSNYRMILEACPDFFKVDRYFVTGAHADPLRMEVLRSIAALGQTFGARVVAEGVESEADLAAVRAAGIGLVQGFLVVRPLSRQALDDVRRAGTSAGVATAINKEKTRC